MNSVLEAKLTISEVKSQLLNLAGSLESDDSTDKKYAIIHLLKIIEFIEERDVKVNEINFKNL